MRPEQGCPRYRNVAAERETRVISSFRAAQVNAVVVSRDLDEYDYGTASRRQAHGSTGPSALSAAQLDLHVCSWLCTDCRLLVLVCMRQRVCTNVRRAQVQCFSLLRHCEHSGNAVQHASLQA
jgi:hypothetical protein